MLYASCVSLTTVTFSVASSSTVKHFRFIEQDTKLLRKGISLFSEIHLTACALAGVMFRA